MEMTCSIFKHFLFLLQCALTIVLSKNQYPTQVTTDEIVVNITGSQYSCSEHFLSVTIDSSEIKSGWRGFNFSSLKLQVMARALSPAYIRIGGTKADFLIFNPYAEEKAVKGTLEPLKDDYAHDYGNFRAWWGKSEQEFTMTGAGWRNMTRFFELVGWDVIFDFNVFIRHKGHWNPKNASSLLEFSEINGIDIFGFQLGNEPNAYMHNFNISIPPSVLLSDFITLRNQLNDHPKYRPSILFGPDVTHLSNGSSSAAYFQQFVQSGACSVMDYLSFHHYYLDGRIATANDFLNEKVLDSLIDSILLAKSIMSVGSCSLPLSLTETSSCYGGGAPGLSDRYIAGFLWLDKLGLSALNGLAQVFRQTFYGGSYSLISSQLDPTPDFFLSVLFKMLVQGPVLQVEKKPDNVRVYANCASTPLYPPGAFVIYFLNLRDSYVNVTLSQFSSLQKDVYLLTPGDSNGLKSSYVKLNGILLDIVDSKLPPLLPKTVQGAVTLEPQSFGFLVVPDAKLDVCIKARLQK